MISISGVVWLIVYILVAGVIYYLLDLLIEKAPFVPPQFKQIAHYVLLVCAILVAIGLLLNFLGVGVPFGGGGPVFRQ